jgi:hypothetical protein
MTKGIFEFEYETKRGKSTGVVVNGSRFNTWQAIRRTLHFGQQRPSNTIPTVIYLLAPGESQQVILWSERDGLNDDVLRKALRP